MIKVYIGKILNLSYIPLLYPNLGFQEKKTLPFLSKSFKYLKRPYVEIVDDPSRADFLLIPHNYFLIKDKKDYIGHFISLSKNTKKKIIIFAYGDSDESINISHSIIFRTSQYKYKKKINEIIMPAYVEDLIPNGDIILRDKKEKPIVGFCGFAGLDSLMRKIKYVIKLFLTKGVHRQGIFFRRRAIKVLNRSSLVETNFIVRKFYSCHTDTIKISPAIARDEYIKNMIDSDFILAPKGDGNFSMRFYESLSLARIPILIDTETILPLENIIDYDSFILRVNYKNINKLDKIVADFYNQITNEEFIEMQKRARKNFEKYLRIDAFFNYVFPQLNKNKGFNDKNV